MTGPPTNRVFQSAPPIKRAKPDGIPVRLHDGTLVAHVNREIEERLLSKGAAESLRHGARRYLRLRQGIYVPHTPKGWEIMEFLRRWHGDSRAAAYVEHKDGQSESHRYEPPSRSQAREGRAR
jgi:hypothetical protein